MATNFKCALYDGECEYDNYISIKIYIRRLQDERTSDCYHKKDNFRIAYMETESYNKERLMFGLFIFFILLGLFIVIIICVCHKHRPVRKEQETYNMHPVDMNDGRIYHIQTSDDPPGKSASNTKRIAKERKKLKPPKVTVGILRMPMSSMALTQR